VHGKQQAVGLAVRVGGPGHVLVQDRQHSGLELFPRCLVQGEGKAVEAGGGAGSGLGQLGLERLQHRLGVDALGDRALLETQRPGLAGGAVRLLEGALLALADLVGNQEAAFH
jgi:hypothetical protein